MVDLRKRKAPAEAAPAPASKKSNLVTGAATKVKEAVTGKKPAATNGTSSRKATAGSTVTLEGFGGEIETNDGEKTSLMKLVEESKAGVVLFTYPKASTPGCTTQACLFRDQFTPLTATGFAIYGLSRDSPKSNTTFKTKQNLPYALLCDPSATLIGAIGMKKAPSGTTRGVFVVNNEGKVLAAEAGSPAGTVEVVKKLVGESGSVEETGTVVSKGEKAVEEGTAPAEADGAVPETDGDAEDKAQADVAADVADSAEKLDGKGTA